MTVIEGKSAYPYITEFKKEPFKSFLLLKKREIGNFYLSNYDKVLDYYRYFDQNLFEVPNLNLENIYWFLLLRKYLGREKDEKNDKFYNFIVKCAFSKENKLGFKFTPNSKNHADVWSTYFALASLKLLNLLKDYLFEDGNDQRIKEIMNFLLGHKKGNIFRHCLDNNCEIDIKTSPARTLYFILESFTLLGIDVRSSKDKFTSYLGNIKKEPSLVYKLLCFKLLDLEYDVNEKNIQFLLQYQKEDGGFSFQRTKGTLNTTFWLVYTLDNYYWLYDYNPIGIYSFLNSILNEILNNESNRNPIKLMELSKSIILLSVVFNKFINEIERVIFKQLELEKYVDLHLITKKFGLSNGIGEVLSYINTNYRFNLKILDNTLEFNNFVRNLKNGEKIIIQEIYEQLKKNNIISLKDIFKRYKSSYRYEPLRLKEDVFPLIQKMMEKNFFKGKIIKKRFSTFYFYLDFFIEKTIVSDTDINLTQILHEKEKLSEIKNDIYNMTLKLKNIYIQIKEEIESYLIIDEIDYAKERLKFILRNALMDADFLNENIENSFNLDLYYIDIQNVLKNEISKWYELYSILSKRLNETDAYLKEKIAEKEELRNLNKTLDQLDEKINVFRDSINRKLDEFKINLKEFGEEENKENAFYNLIQDFEKIRINVREFDNKIYEISNNIKPKEDIIIQKRNRVINNWVSINEELESVFDYYYKGFDFFKGNLEKLYSLEKEINEKTRIIKNRAQEKIKHNKFKDAFNLIKIESDDVLINLSKEIDKTQEIINNEIKIRQKFYVLYRTLHEMFENLEVSIIESVDGQINLLKNEVIEERNKTEIYDFDKYVSEEMSNIKFELNNYKENIERIKNKKIKNITGGFDRIRKLLDESHKIYLKKLENCKDCINNFDESNVTVVKWNNFYEYLSNEISVLKEEYINQVIMERIYDLTNEKKTNKVNVLDLKKELDLNCNILIDRIKNLIEISKINGKLYENEKCVLVYTEAYYKNRELRNFIDNKLLKQNQETIAKILTLYDSSVRNRTLNVNMLELQNRIKDLIDFENILKVQFNNKLIELHIEINNRLEYIETAKYFESIINNNRIAIETISNNLELFNKIHVLIEQMFSDLTNILLLNYKKNIEEIGRPKEKSYINIKENCDNKWFDLKSKLKITQESIEEELKDQFAQNNDLSKLTPQIREFLVKKKKIFLKEFQDKKDKVYDELIILKDGMFRETLIDHITEEKIKISQLLGTLQARVEDDIEIANHKIANHKIQKRAKAIEDQISILNKNIKTMVKNFNKESSGFETKNKYVIEDFNRFISEFKFALEEKVKSLEHLIIKSYIDMTIKAVSNEYLTIGFLNHELKIKKQRIQDHVIFLISDGRLKGKYDPRLGIYYENPEVLDRLDADELEVIKSMNLKMYLLVKRLKSFASMYGSILGLFASILAITYWFYIFSGNNPAVAAIPFTILLLVIFYFMFKRSKDKIA